MTRRSDGLQKIIHLVYKISQLCQTKRWIFRQDRAQRKENRTFTVRTGPRRTPHFHAAGRVLPCSGIQAEGARRRLAPNRVAPESGMAQIANYVISLPVVILSRRLSIKITFYFLASDLLICTARRAFICKRSVNAAIRLK
jgi:hypothetical protein